MFGLSKTYNHETQKRNTNLQDHCYPVRNFTNLKFNTMKTEKDFIDAVNQLIEKAIIEKKFFKILALKTFRKEIKDHFKFIRKSNKLSNL